MRCFNGQRMDFELVADHQAGAVEFDWFGRCSFVRGRGFGSNGTVFWYIPIESDTPKIGITMEMWN